MRLIEDITVIEIRQPPSLRPLYLLRIGVLGGPILGEGALAQPGQALDSFGQVGIGDVVGVFGNPDVVGLEQDLGVGEADGWLEFVAGQFVALPQGIAEVDRVHKAAIDLGSVLDIALVEPRGHLREDGA